MIVYDSWSYRRLVQGVVAYHDAKNRNEDAEKAFWSVSGMRFKTAEGNRFTGGHDATVPAALLEYPDFAAAALVVVDLDYEYRMEHRGHSVWKNGKPEWTPEQIEEWKAKRKAAYDRYDMLRVMIDHESKGFEIKSPA